jgi:hypothetical protein
VRRLFQLYQARSVSVALHNCTRWMIRNSSCNLCAVELRRCLHSARLCTTYACFVIPILIKRWHLHSGRAKFPGPMTYNMIMTRHALSRAHISGSGCSHAPRIECLALKTPALLLLSTPCSMSHLISVLHLRCCELMEASGWACEVMCSCNALPAHPHFSIGSCRMLASMHALGKSCILMFICI